MARSARTMLMEPQRGHSVEVGDVRSCVSGPRHAHISHWYLIRVTGMIYVSEGVYMPSNFPYNDLPLFVRYYNTEEISISAADSVTCSAPLSTCTYSPVENNWKNKFQLLPN